MSRKVLVFGNFPFNLENEFIDTNHIAWYYSQNGGVVDFITSPAYYSDIFTFFIEKTKKRLKNFAHSGIFINTNMTQYTPLIPFPLRNFFPLNTGFNASLFREGFKIYKFTRENYDICFVSQGFMLLWADLIKAKTYVYRYNDLLEGFGSHPSILSEYEERFLKNRCNLILAVNERLKEHLLNKYPWIKNIKVLPNGVDFNSYRYAYPDKDLMSIKKKKVIFCGSIDFWVDVDLLYQLASALKDIVLVIVGPARVSIRKVLKLPNVVYLGSRNFRDIPSILKACDVGVIPFVKNRLTEYIEKPLKYYEYLASGMPVVAIGISESRDRNEYVKIVKDKALFIEVVDRIKVYDSEERKKIQSTVESCDWSVIFQMMESYIKELE